MQPNLAIQKNGIRWYMVQYIKAIEAVQKECSNVLSRSTDQCVLLLQEPTLTDQEKQFKNERGGGNYGAGTRALQEQNFMARQKRDKLRKEMFEDALNKFRANDIEQVSAGLASYPRKYVLPA